MQVMPKVWNKHHKDYPKDAVYIGRGSPWGNHFVIGKDGDREEVIRRHAAHLEALMMMHPGLRDYIKKNLAGKDLVCFCAPKACHGDLLLQIANEKK